MTHPAPQGAARDQDQDQDQDHYDVIIVGAGLSGIGAACLLREQRPQARFAILEARDAIGGTWDLFRYPGVRSDSDMFTLGYSFRPWPNARAIADGRSIRDYIRATAAERGVDRAIRFGHRVVAADWESGPGRWRVTAERAGGGSPVQLTCSWLSVCSGYFDYEQGYRPRFAGEERFGGPVVHPQHWPEDLDLAGKRVVVIGSGATAVTLVPALCGQAAHVTMLQRTPSYIVSLPATDPVARALDRWLPSRPAHALARWKNVLFSTGFYSLARRRPAAIRAFIRKTTARALPPGYDVGTHFNPPYQPWDQRLCLVPDGDLFRVLRSGRADVVTDRIASFTEDGIELESGRALPADVIVTATGLSLLPVGGISLSVGGVPVALPDTVCYKGMMLSGVPNFNMVIGYTNNSWTLKADLVSRYVIRLLEHMQARGYDRATPVPPAGEPADQPLLDLTSGYIRRSLAALPRQGRRAPWRLYQNYLRDAVLMRFGRLADEGIRFSRGPLPPSAPPGPGASGSRPAEPRSSTGTRTG